MNSRLNLMMRAARFGAAMLCVASSSAPSRAAALDVANMWIARFSGLKGMTDCPYGAERCNRCVYRVRQQFRDLAQDGRVEERVKHWTWKSESYDPAGIDPSDIFDPLPSGGSHVQGFARVSGERASFITTWAGEDRAVFVAEGPAWSDGRVGNASLRYVVDPPGHHVNGIQPIGRYVLVSGEEEHGDVWTARLQSIALDSLPARSAIKTVVFPNQSRVSSMGATRLRGGGYLVLANERGNNNNFGLFYTATLDNPHLELISKLHAEDPDGIGPYVGKRGHYAATLKPRLGGLEGLSMVTECETGDVYVTGVTGPAVGTYLLDKGYWGLLRLEQGPAPRLVYVERNTRDMHNAECDTRAGGSAFAGPDGELALYCSQKGHRSEIRRDVTGCVLSSASGFIFGATHFCGSTVISSREVEFREFWPTRSYLVKKAVSAKNTLTIVINGEPGRSLGVVEPVSGAICETDAEIGHATCTWSIERGQAQVLVPFGDPGLFGDPDLGPTPSPAEWEVAWQGRTCGDRHTTFTSSDGEPRQRAVECAVEMTKDQVVTLGVRPATAP